MKSFALRQVTFVTERKRKLRSQARPDSYSGLEHKQWRKMPNREEVLGLRLLYSKSGGLPMTRLCYCAMAGFLENNRFRRHSLREWPPQQRFRIFHFRLIG